MDQLVVELARYLEVEDFARSVVEHGFDTRQALWLDGGKVGALGPELSEQAVEIFVAGVLPASRRGLKRDTIERHGVNTVLVGLLPKLRAVDEELDLDPDVTASVVKSVESLEHLLDLLSMLAEPAPGPEAALEPVELLQDPVRLHRFLRRVEEVLVVLDRLELEQQVEQDRIRRTQ